VQSQVDITAVFYRCLSRRQLAVADLLLDQCAVEIHHLQEHLYQLTEDLNVEGVTWLLEHGANPDYRRTGTRWTPLHNALHTYPTLNRNRQQICHLLIGRGPITMTTPSTICSGRLTVSGLASTRLRRSSTPTSTCGVDAT
jgi:hypothetical protein